MFLNSSWTFQMVLKQNHVTNEKWSSGNGWITITCTMLILTSLDIMTVGKPPCFPLHSSLSNRTLGTEKGHPLSPHLSKLATTHQTCTDLTLNFPMVISQMLTTLTSPPCPQYHNPLLPFCKELTWQMCASFSVWSSGAWCTLTAGSFPNLDRTAFIDLSCSYTCPELCKTRQWVYRRGKTKSSCKKHGLHSLFAWHEVLEAGPELSLPWQLPLS